MSPQQTATFIREQISAGGLFAGMEWKISPTPFPLGENLAKEIESLGYFTGARFSQCTASPKPAVGFDFTKSRRPP
jgi:hypothetical protein